MDHFINIYTHHADKYHQLIIPEDVETNNVTRTLHRLRFFY